MKHYKIIYPDEQGNHVEEVLSEQDILDHYWNLWSGSIAKAGKEDMISTELCIEDWIVVNWAMEIKDSDEH